MSTLVIILARGGSKGVPRKNARLIAGRPCIMWTIDAARLARHNGAADLIVLSTDDDQLQQFAIEAGIDVVARPPELASDIATVDDAARHAVTTVESVIPGRTFEHIVILYGNVPVRPPELIERAVGMLRTTNADSVQSYQPVGKYHPWWMVVLDPVLGQIKPWEGDTLNHGVYRRQDLPPVYIPDGGVLAVTRRALFLEVPGAAPGPHAFFGVDRRGIINPLGSVVDIDHESDLAAAEIAITESDQSIADRPIAISPSDGKGGPWIGAQGGLG